MVWCLLSGLCGPSERFCVGRVDGRLKASRGVVSRWWPRGGFCGEALGGVRGSESEGESCHTLLNFK